ncbi:translation initiation factor IF-3, partial [Candidatus Microgenomates bacterium]|nr:translation initiation factor IF-3 [Candidatus Microgenomates bacterium]
KQIGVVAKDEALKKAQEAQLDLVEIASNAVPPVVKIIDFKKFLYQEEKRRREERKKTHSSETKEIRLGPFTHKHDLKTKLSNAQKFLQQGNKIRLVVKFSGRQITHPEFGQRVLQTFIGGLTDISKVDREPRFEGKLLITLLSPERKKAYAKDENKKGDTQAI